MVFIGCFISIEIVKRIYVPYSKKSDKELSGRTAGSPLGKAVNMGNSERSNPDLISFINALINAFIVKE